MDKYNISIKRYPQGNSQIKIYKKAINNNFIRDNSSTEQLLESKYYDILNFSTDNLKLTKAREILNRLNNHKIHSFKSFDEWINCSDDECPFDIEPIVKLPNFRKLNDNNKRDKQLVYDLARSNDWDWFATITFNPNKYNRQDYDECRKALSKLLNNIRNRYCPDLKYLFIPELHSDGINWHFHGLLSNCTDLHFTQSINGKIGSKFYGLPLKDKNGNDVFVCNHFSKLGNCTFTKVKDTRRVSNYITKYITKQNNAHFHFCL